MTETMTPSTATVDHPLAMLSAAEMTRAGEIILGSGRLPESARFVHLVLHEPPKAAVLAWQPGDPIDRQARALVVPGPGLDFVETVVSVTTGAILEWQVIEGMRPALMFGESMVTISAVKEHPDWQAAMRRRGITDFAHVQLDPWPAGNFGLALEDGRRISRVLSYLRESKTDNGYARPIEGVLVFFDMSAGKVIEVADYGLTPLPPERSSYLPEDVGPARTDLRPLEITQPEGPSFTVEGNLVKWQRWSLRVGFDPYEGLTLAHGRLRGRRDRPPDPVPRVGERDGRAVRTPGPDARVEERVRRGRVGSRSDDAVAHARVRLPRCHPLLRRAAQQRAGQALHDRQRDLHARRGLRHPLEALRPARRHLRGAPLAAARRQLDRHRRQLRVRLLLVLLPRRLDPARGEAHRRHLADGGRAGRAAGVRGARRARRRGAEPSASLQRAPRLRHRRRRQHGLRVRRRGRAARPRQPVGQRVAFGRDAVSTPSSRRSATSTRRGAGSGRS